MDHAGAGRNPVDRAWAPRPGDRRLPVLADANPVAGEVAYQRGTCPGRRATRTWIATCPTTASTAQGRHPWPDAEDFTAKLGALGHHAPAPGRRLRRWRRRASPRGSGSCCATLGHEKVAVLDGGWSRWTALGLPVDSRRRQPMRAALRGAVRRPRDCSMPTQVQERPRRRRSADRCARGRTFPRRERTDRPGRRPRARARSIGPMPTTWSTTRFKPPVQLAAEFRELLGAHRARARHRDVRQRRHRLPPPAGDGTRRSARARSCSPARGADGSPIRAPGGDRRRLTAAPSAYLPSLRDQRAQSGLRVRREPAHR